LKNDQEKGINIPHHPKSNKGSQSSNASNKPKFNSKIELNKLKPSFANIAVALHAAAFTPKLSWIADTGANVSISPDKKDFIELQPIQEIPIHSANNDTITSTASGNVRITDANRHELILEDVLYAPGYPVHILSIPAARRQGVTPSFSDDGDSISL
jgi:hypothetical protein